MLFERVAHRDWTKISVCSSIHTRLYTRVSQCCPSAIESNEPSSRGWHSGLFVVTYERVYRQGSLSFVRITYSSKWDVMVRFSSNEMHFLPFLSSLSPSHVLLSGYCPLLRFWSLEKISILISKLWVENSWVGSWIFTLWSKVRT